MMFGLTDYEIELNVLIIEDNPADARLLEILLEDTDLQCNVVQKRSLSSGVEALQERRFDVVLLDLFLPDSRGIETLYTLLNTFSDLNVIVLTGLTSKDIGIKTVQAGAQDFLVKGEFDAEQLSKALRYSMERNEITSSLEQAQRIAHIGNWAYQQNNKTFLASDEVYRIYGYEPKSRPLTFALLKERVHPNDRPLIRQIINAATQTATASRLIRVFRTDGSLRYVMVVCKRTQGRDGKPFFSGIIQDITDQKQAELESIKSQERYQAIFTQSKDAILITDPRGIISYCNPATAELFGYATLDKDHHAIANFFVEPTIAHQLFAELKAQGYLKDAEALFRRKDGEQITCSISASELRTEGLSGYNFILRDITELRRAADMRKAKEVAERSALMKEQFLANISHEMRTPLNAILGMANLVMDANLRQEQVDYLQSIQQSGKYLLGIINDILEVNTIREEGRVNLKKAPFDIVSLIKKMKQVYQFQAKAKLLDFHLVFQSDIPNCVIGDELRLSQIITNLVSNAIKFTEQGSVTIRVAALPLADAPNHLLLRVEVEDTGIGIPADRLDDVFETFVRITNPNKLYPGTGLGLPIAKQLARLQQGDITLKSELGKGSVFTATVRLETEQLLTTATAAPTAPIEADTREPQLGRPIKILLVEDHKLNQVVAKRTIEKTWANAQVTLAENGKIGIEKFFESDFDAVLMDVQMPVMDGYEATQYIRAHAPHPKAATPIIAMTAHAHIADNHHHKQYGMDDYVLKPFDPKDLFSKLAFYINKQLS